MITNLTLNRTHYCRYELPASVITATITHEGSPTDPITMTLSRRTLGADLVITSQEVQGTSPIAATIDLVSLRDADGLMAAVCSHEPNDYTLTVTDGSSLLSKTLTIVPVTVEEMKNRWCKGLRLIAPERLQIKQDPITITGVTVTEISADSILGVFPLVYLDTPKTLAWAGGEAVTVPDGVNTLILPDAAAGYLVVSVDADALPDDDTTESLLVQQWETPDEDIVAIVLHSYYQVQLGLHVNLEPRRVVSRILLDPLLNTSPPASYDIVGEPVGYYQTPGADQWVSIKIPHRSLLKVNTLQGWLNRGKSVEPQKEWITWNEKSGLIQLVPSNAAVMSWQFYGLGFYLFFANYQQIPNFWQYDVVAGLREIPIPLQEYIARSAAIELLTQAGLARNPGGQSSFSLSRDGVSESRGVNPLGLYYSTIQQYERENGRDKEGNEKGLRQLRQRYAGVSMVTL